MHVMKLAAVKSVNHQVINAIAAGSGNRAQKALVIFSVTLKFYRHVVLHELPKYKQNAFVKTIFPTFHYPTGGVLQRRWCIHRRTWCN